MGTQQNKPAAKAAPAPQAEAQNEETIAGYLRDVVRNVKKSSKAVTALADLGNDEAVAPALAALKARKEKLAKAAAQRVFDYVMKVE